MKGVKFNITAGGKTGVSFFHECDPPRSTAQQRQFFRNGNALTPSAKKAAATWLAIVERHKPDKPMEGPLCLSISVTWRKKGIKDTEPRTARPDVDNLAKLILDAMTKAGYWHDDKQVCSLWMGKYNGPIPGVYVAAAEYEL